MEACNHTSRGSSQPVPVTVIGGYLGAGKTTLINRLLQGNRGFRIAVLVNDFGEINIDASLIARHDGQTLELTNGCVCCSIGDDLGGALATVSATMPRPDYIVIEASGVADPSRVANYTYGQPGLKLDGIIVLADSETVESRATDRFVGTTVRRQLASADILVLTKTDLVAVDQIRKTEKWLQKVIPGVPLIRNDDCGIGWDVLFGLGKPLKGFDADHATQEPHNQLFATATWQEDALLDRDRLVKGLRSFDNALLRCKGWVRFADNPGTSVLIQLVGNRLELTDDMSERMGSQHALSFIYLRDRVSAQNLLDMVSACKVVGSSQTISASLDAI